MAGTTAAVGSLVGTRSSRTIAASPPASARDALARAGSSPRMRRVARAERCQVA
jgi:hypothetical protein